MICFHLGYKNFFCDFLRSPITSEFIISFWKLRFWHEIFTFLNEILHERDFLTDRRRTCGWEIWPPTGVCKVRWIPWKVSVLIYIFYGGICDCRSFYSKIGDGLELMFVEFRGGQLIDLILWKQIISKQIHVTSVCSVKNKT